MCIIIPFIFIYFVPVIQKKKSGKEKYFACFYVFRIIILKNKINLVCNQIHENCEFDIKFQAKNGNTFFRLGEKKNLKYRIRFFVSQLDSFGL